MEDSNQTTKVESEQTTHCRGRDSLAAVAMQENRVLILAGMLELSNCTFAADMLTGVGFRARELSLAQVRNGDYYQQDSHAQGRKDVQQRRLFEINQESNQK